MKTRLYMSRDGLTDAVRVVRRDLQIRWIERKALEQNPHNYRILRNERGKIIGAVQVVGLRASAAKAAMGHSHLGEGEAFRQQLECGRVWALAGVAGSEVEADKRQHCAYGEALL